MLTTDGTDAHRIRREPDGRLVMTSLTRGAGGDPTMTLNRIDKEFRHEGISYLDYKQVEMDRVLTAFLPRLWWGGPTQRHLRGTRATSPSRTSSETIAEHPESFEDFDPAVTAAVGGDPPAGHGEPRQADPGGRGPAAAARVHLPVPQRPPVPGVRRGRAALRDAQPRVRRTGHGARSRDLKDFFFAGVDAPH